MIPEAFRNMIKKSIVAFAMVALLVAAGSAKLAGAVVIGDLRLETASGRVLLNVAASEQVTPKLEPLSDKLVIHIPGADRARIKPISIQNHGIKQIRFGKHDGELRVVIDMEKPAEARVTKFGPQGFVVDLGAAAAKVEAAEAEAEAPVTGATGLTYRLVDVSLNQVEDHSQIVISSDGPASYRPSVKNDGKLISVLLRNSSLAWTPGAATLSDVAVKRVSVKQVGGKGESQVRVDIELKGKFAFTINRDQNQVVVSVEKPEADASSGSDKAGAAAGNLDALVSLDVEQADLVGTVKNLATQAGFECQFTNTLINLDQDARLVTFRAVKRPLREVLTTLLANKTASFEQQGNTLLCGSTTEIKAVKDALLASEANSDGDGSGGLQTKIFTLKYLDATDKDLITNSVNLVVPDTLRNSTPKGFDSYFDPGSHRLVVTSSDKYIKKIEDLLKHIDVRVPQVHIEGKIIEVDDSKSKSLGINWTYSQTNRTNGTVTGSGTFDASQGQVGAAIATYSNIQALSNLTASIDALVAKNSANVISSPSVTAKDGSPATMQSSESLVTSSQTIIPNNNNSPTITTSFSTQQIPITLKVTPRINPKDRTIEMMIHFDLSTATAAPPAGSGQPAPISQQTVDTIVTVGNNETTVIGGLNRDSTVRSSTEVPFFGSIPLIGLLFRGELVQKVKKDIIVFITPTLEKD